MPHSRSTIGVNPLDALFDRATSAAPAETSPARLAPASATGGNAGTAHRRLTVQLPASLIDGVRNAVYWTPGLTVTALTQRALEAALRDIEAARGGVFPPRAGRLPPGPPLATSHTDSTPQPPHPTDHCLSHHATSTRPIQPPAQTR